MTIYRATANTAVILAIFMVVYVGLVKSAWILALGSAVSLVVTAVLFTGLHEIITQLKALRAAR